MTIPDPSRFSRSSSRTPARAGLAAAALLVVATVAGCGSGSTASSSPAVPPAPSSPAPTSAPSSPAPSAPSSAPSPAPGAPSTPPVSHPTEFSPPGDIPDNAVFVDHTAPGSRVHLTVPEGWAQSSAGATTTFTDKYNSVGVAVRQQQKPSTVASAQSTDVAALQRTESKFQLEDVTQVTRQHGSAVLVRYLEDSAPDPVTDKVVRDEVLRFEFWHAGQEAILSLTGPQNADNVDPWQIVSDSLEWR